MFKVGDWVMHKSSNSSDSPFEIEELHEIRLGNEEVLAVYTNPHGHLPLSYLRLAKEQDFLDAADYIQNKIHSLVNKRLGIFSDLNEFKETKNNL